MSDLCSDSSEIKNKPKSILLYLNSITGAKTDNGGVKNSSASKIPVCSASMVVFCTLIVASCCSRVSLAVSSAAQNPPPSSDAADSLDTLFQQEQQNNANTRLVVGRDFPFAGEKLHNIIMSIHGCIDAHSYLL